MLNKRNGFLAFLALPGSRANFGGPGVAGKARVRRFPFGEILLARIFFDSFLRSFLLKKIWPIYFIEKMFLVCSEEIYKFML